MIDGVRYWLENGQWYRELTKEEKYLAACDAGPGSIRDHPIYGLLYCVPCDPPDPDGVGAGYRLVSAGELVADADEWYDDCRWWWLARERVGTVRQLYHGTMRRPITEWPEKQGPELKLPDADTSHRMERSSEIKKDDDPEKPCHKELPGVRPGISNRAGLRHSQCAGVCGKTVLAPAGGKCFSCSTMGECEACGRTINGITRVSRDFDVQALKDLCVHCWNSRTHLERVKMGWQRDLYERVEAEEDPEKSACRWTPGYEKPLRRKLK